MKITSPTSSSSLSSMKPVVATKDLKRTDSGMEEASSSIKTAATTMANGRKIKCMAGVSYTTKEGSLPTRGTGRMTSFTGTVKSTMTTQSSWTQASIIQTSICWMISGNTTKECWPTTPRRAEVGFSSRTKKCSRATFTLTEFKGSANSYAETTPSWKVSGETRASLKSSGPTIFIDEIFTIVNSLV